MWWTRTGKSVSRLPLLAMLLVAQAGFLLTGCGDIPSGKFTSVAEKDGRYKDKCKDSVKNGRVEFFDAPAPAGLPAEAPVPGMNTESYDHIADNPFHSVKDSPLSTFSVDVDTASYSNMRRFLNEGRLPPPDAVRIEEMLNYFTYEYPQPQGEHPIGVHTEVTECPWKPAHRLVRIGIQAKHIDARKLPPRNFVFLIDVSGSMNHSNKLPLVKSSLTLLARQLTANDRVALVVYAGQSGLVLPATPGNEQHKVLAALHSLESGGSTNGGQGIQLAYRIARENYLEEGVNRVILCTDGDFNVGVSSQGELIRLVEEKRKSGVFLTVLGYGMGNLKDSTLEKLADHGDGHYAYIDSEAEARKVFVEQGGALVTVAKDVKIQVEFNPRKVGSYRLVGYENRLLRDRDFNDDAKDAGDVGAGHQVTALYEIVPAAKGEPTTEVDALKYQQERKPSQEADGNDLLTVKVRYKEPKEEQSKLLSKTVTDVGRKLAHASSDQKLAAAVATFGMVLRESKHKGAASPALALDLTRAAQGDRWTNDVGGHRAEFLNLVETAQGLGR